MPSARSVPSMLSTKSQSARRTVRDITSIMRAERRRAEQLFDRTMAQVFADSQDHPDSAEEPSDDMPFTRDYEDDGLDTAPVLKAGVR